MPLEMLSPKLTAVAVDLSITGPLPRERSERDLNV